MNPFENANGNFTLLAREIKQNLPASMRPAEEMLEAKSARATSWQRNIFGAKAELRIDWAKSSFCRRRNLT
jgi:hypothetical protein